MSDSRKRKQLTLACWKGFKKEVEHRGKKLKIDLPTVAKDKGVTCDICKKEFINTQGLGCHKLKCEKEHRTSHTITHTHHERTKAADNQVDIVTQDVEKVLSSVVDEVVQLIEKKPSRRRGANRRESFTALFKAKVLKELLYTDKSQYTVAEQFKVNQSMVSKWLKNKNDIFSQAAIANKKALLKQRSSKKYLPLYDRLLISFKEARGKGYHVNFNWLWSRARNIYREQHGQNAIVKKHVIESFLRRFNIRMRCRQRNRKQSKESFREDLRKWHGLTRERLIRTGSKDDYDKKWGRFLPNQRFNVDQSPLPFVVDVKRTYEQIEYKHSEKIWIAQPGSGLDKRQCTLQILTRAEGEQPRIAVIFRGKGKRISPDEKMSWHQDVDIYWQENAWADTEVSVEWIKGTLSKSVQGLSRFVLFLDNLNSQESEQFKSSVSELNGVAWYGLKNATDLWQVVDAGIAQLHKVLIGQAHREWLDKEGNADKWYGNDSQFTASERRILITHWVGDAWKKLCSPEYDNFRRRCWEKTGCLLTADGSEDEKITPEGLKLYKVPPPAVYLPAAEEVPKSNEGTEESIESVDEDVNEELEPDGRDCPDDDGDEWEDHEDDRVLDAPYCGMRMKILYENGWHVGKINYYNDHLQKYNVTFDDDSEDYVGADDIDMVEVCVF